MENEGERQKVYSAELMDGEGSGEMMPSSANQPSLVTTLVITFIKKYYYCTSTP
jgi:hypothetical protein